MFCKFFTPPSGSWVKAAETATNNEVLVVFKLLQLNKAFYRLY